MNATRRLWSTGGLVQSGWMLMAVVLAATVLRVIAWRGLNGPIIAGDGPEYLDWAQHLAVGDFSSFRDFPLHQLYPMMIAPAFVAGLPLGQYLFVLHLTLSVGTILCLYYACRQFTTRGAAIVAATAAGTYPALLFWFPYVLSETPFFFFLSLFLFSLTGLLSRRRALGPRWVAFAIFAGALLLIARPASVAILGVSAVAVAYVLLSQALGDRRARLVTTASLLIVVGITTAALSIDTPLRSALLRYPTVAQSLWLSTRLSSSSMAEWATVLAEHRALADRFAGNQDALWDYKVREASEFIRAHPGTYTLMAVRRLASFWLPSLFSEGWSATHRLFDVALMAVLLIGTVISMYRRRDIVRWTLLSAALALGGLTSLSQIDTDGRYRMPADLILLMLAADGYARVVVHAVGQWRGRTRGGVLAARAIRQ